MKTLIFTIIGLSANLIFANPVWVEYHIKVDNPESAANIVLATDNLMGSSYAKENFKGSLHLNTWIANGNDLTTHTFAVLQPSLTDHLNWNLSLQESEEGSAFLSILRDNSTALSERVNSFIQTYGNPSNEDVFWIVHEFAAKPSDLEKIINAHGKMDKGTKDDFPGQYGLSAVAFGSGEVTHLLTVGYKSMAELESWEDQVASNKAVQNFLKTMDKMVEWKGSKVLTNSRVYDTASDLEQFVNKDFE